MQLKNTYLKHREIMALFKVFDGESDFATGSVSLLFGSLFDLTASYETTEYSYASRLPRPVVTYGNVAKPFSALVWGLSAACLAMLSLFFTLAHKMYQSKHMSDLNLASLEESPLNFFLFTFAKLSESDALPWFRKWSSAKMGVFIWVVFSTFLVLFYTSNLRAHMITVEYEKPLHTLEDIVQNGKPVYLPTALHLFR